jgi:hypothetical protein
MNNKSQKNKRNTCFPHTSRLVNAPQTNSDKVNDNTDNYFLLINKVTELCVLYRQTTIKTFFFENHNLHILVSISSCSWYELHMEALKHI